jgi:methionyl aminopeptidase
MIVQRTSDEVELLRQSNQLVSKTLAEIAKHIRPGVSTRKLDMIAEEFIRDHHAVPAFLGYHGFPRTLCTSINSVVVHGIPSDACLQEGDIISVDCGVLLNGYYGDSAYTFPVGKVQPEVMMLLRTTHDSLFKGIEQAVEGNRIGDIGFAVQSHCESAGYSVVREMVGHGLGRKLHEEPEVPNYGKRGSGTKLKSGYVICIEPMINMGTRHVRQESDGWTIRTIDNKPSAHYELCVAVSKGKADVLSTFQYIEEVVDIFNIKSLNGETSVN